MKTKTTTPKMTRNGPVTKRERAVEWIAGMRSRGISLDIEKGQLVLDRLKSASDLQMARSLGVPLLTRVLLAQRKASRTDASVMRRIALTDVQYEEAGFVKDADLGWCHPEGDGVGDLILDGVISFAEAKAIRTDREQRAKAMAHNGQTHRAGRLPAWVTGLLGPRG
jgi:hypothetical protein